MHMNNGSLKLLYIDDPEGRTKYGDNKLLEQQTNSANLIPAGWKSWVRSELVQVKIYPSRLCEVCNKWKMICFLSFLSYRFTVNKMIPEISIRAKHRTNERHDETSERGKEL